uniref:CPXV009 protein CPXV222 protein n=1 Tax=Cowpox virus TaxID=10243 RepID=A0A6J7ZC82_COWPX|nr:CPXV009 protein; CPXV222 protein [Cowpox virus]CAB5514211.1 CPXV009 protein; CPXV222 protein [Cowpox virus]
MASQCGMLSPCHCHGTRESMLSVNEVKHCLTEYIMWLAHKWLHRESAGPLYRLLISFRNDASDVFGDLKEIESSLPWDNVESCTNIIKCIIKNDAMKTTKEVCAIIGLCTQAVIFREEGLAGDRWLNVMIIMRKILHENDYVTLWNHIRTVKS